MEASHVDPIRSSVFFPVSFFWATRDIFRKSDRDTKKVPVTILEKVPVTIVVLNVQNAITIMIVFFYPWQYFKKGARDNFQKSARDTEKLPVTSFNKQKCLVHF